jgi:hypothetical protein
VVALLVALVSVLYSPSLSVADDSDDSFRYALSVTVWNHWHHCYMCTLAVYKCIRTPCLSFSWNTSDDETYHALFAVPWLRASCIFSPSIWFVCVSEHSLRFGSLLSPSGLPVRQCLSNVPLGFGDGPESLYSTFSYRHIHFGIDLTEDRII